ncbi:type II secretion system protein [Ideonella paludis]|uniref:Prepilin-type N-terminal cleavage/methylation domain-containing protein n=1 Tax=Ideonella paludis TaxID=1233411 RepID=A0ABS5E321_9BURK|nr:prepilin-type N-terminal cleavage/methylation domain-containing protein [Ideonella paludis]MBQ0937820.1 prepilin-type N-terminal cleavage/methylation domain-containing protein [Ideonella paludis]
MTHSLQQRRSSQGFTLVEMAIVMVIIGVILAAVMIGRDTQKNAEYLRIKQTFVNQWALSYNTFVQRYGFPLGDQMDAPKLMVNGSLYSGPTGGDLSGVTAPLALCGPAAPTGSKLTRGNAKAKDASGTEKHVLEILQSAGVELPRGRGKGLEDKYAYLDTNGNPQELQACFQWNPPGTVSGAGNVMVITGLTPDLARNLDNGLDGVINASAGTFRLEGVTANVVDWGANNQTMLSGSTADGQVGTLTAHYRMNQ